MIAFSLITIFPNLMGHSQTWSPME